MAVTQRRMVDNFVGSLKNGCTALDTSLTADAFVQLSSDYSTTQAMPLVIADDSQGLFEVVLITGHNAGTNIVTVRRGQQGTTARQWDAGAVVRVSVTRRDLVDSMTKSAATNLGDTHVGMEIVDTATGILNKQTASQGFHALAHVMQGGIGGGLMSTYTVQSGQELLAQSGFCSGVTSAQGYINFTLPAGAFPNAVVAVLATPRLGNTEQPWQAYFFDSFVSTSSTTATPNGPVLQFRAVYTSTNSGVNGTAVKFSVLALGV